MKLTSIAIVALLAVAQAPALRPDPPHKCFDCDEWNRPHRPFKVFGNTFFVGVAGLSSVLINGSDGSILLDAGLPQSAAAIDRNIRALGFQPENIKLIVNSHPHYDHAGGIAALQRLSGAKVAATAAAKRALESGGPTADDPQFAFGREANAFPAIKDVQAVADGETLRVGDLAVTAHAVPGHTPGSSTWTWRSCEGSACKDIVYADSLNAVSADGFKFTGDASHPSLIESFRRSIATVAALRCDVLITVHPVWQANGALKAGSCRAYADEAAKKLDARIAEEARR